MHLRSAVTLAAVVFGSMLATNAQSAEPATPATPAVAEPAAIPLTHSDLEAWLDGFMPYAIGTADIAGAVVVVVKDGEVLLQKGYGYSDVAERKPVDPELTMFRPGSVSKLFTWTAVMQLVEQGKLDLDADVNAYLDFKIPAREGQPVTLRNIMTHTAGFEEQMKGLISVARKGQPVKPFSEQIKRWVPERIFAAGTTPAYSNYATAVAGYIVERVSKEPFEEYIEQHIFAPLGMEHSSFRQPLPERLERFMSKGYAVGSQPAKPYEIVGPAPAGALAASGADMGRFMLAHLRNGEFGSARILQAATARQMHDTALTLLPSVHRMLLGFYEENVNGHRIIGHAGDTQWFHSDLHLFLDDGIGLYVSMNSPGKAGAAGQIRTALLDAFAARYLPGPDPDGSVDEKTAADHARMMVGTYDNSRRADSSFFSLLSLAGPIKVSLGRDNTIVVSNARNLAGVPLKWREIAPFVWRDVDGKTLLAAKVENGRVVRFTFGMVAPFMVFEPTAAAKSPVWLVPALLVGCIALLLTTLAWPISALVRRYYGMPYRLEGLQAQAHRRIRIASTAVLIVLIAWLMTITNMMGNYHLLSDHMNGWLWILKVLSALVFIVAAVIGIWNAYVVTISARKWYAKVWAVLLALGLLVVLWVAFAFHLLSMSVGY